MINFMRAVLKYRNEIKEARKEEKIKAKKRKAQAKQDDDLRYAITLIRKYINDTQYILIGKEVSDAGNFKSWTDVEERMTRIRLIKSTNMEHDWIKELDKKFTEV